MGARNCFLAAIMADPRDAAPRLIFADWLDENGSPKDAAWLRRDGFYRITSPKYSMHPTGIGMLPPELRPRRLLWVVLFNNRSGYSDSRDTLLGMVPRVACSEPGCDTLGKYGGTWRRTHHWLCSGHAQGWKYPVGDPKWKG